jgi:predicted Rossmann-fold nucleotide-binding protein
MVVFPGGFGTLDELFEILTLCQTRKLARPILTLLYGPSYWNEIINFPALVRHGMIAEEDLGLLELVDTPADALTRLRAALGSESAITAPSFARSRTCEESDGKD